MKETYVKPVMQVIDIEKEPIIASSAEMNYGDLYDPDGAKEQFSVEDNDPWGIDWHVNDKD